MLLPRGADDVDPRREPGSEPEWAEPGAATIRPGIAMAMTTPVHALCTANFVFLDTEGTAYLGQAAHCGMPGSALDSDGCSAQAAPLGTEVRLGDSGATGTIAYNSWLTMQQRGETAADACRNNDFALVRIPDSAIGQVNPSIPSLGGPNGLRDFPLGAGEPVFGYSDFPLNVDGLRVLSRRPGAALETGDNGWVHLVVSVPPGIPGNSGGGYIDASGQAFGVLSKIAVSGANLVSDLATILAYAQQHAGIPGLRFVPGTSPFGPTLGD